MIVSPWLLVFIMVAVLALFAFAFLTAIDVRNRSLRRRMAQYVTVPTEEESRLRRAEVAAMLADTAQKTVGGQRWWQRWGPSFDGMHLLMGYQTVSGDNDDEGRLVAGYALAGRTIRESWIQTAIDVQGSSVVWAVMGPIGPGGWVNYNDHFWGRGSVGPDIRGGNLQGWWIIWGPS